MAIRVMSFNLRYDNPKDGQRSWSHRQNAALSTIQKFNIDVLGVQEAVSSQATYLRDQLSDMNYTGAGRFDGQWRGEQVAIYARHTRFETLSSGHQWLSETPDVIGSKSWDSAFPRLYSWVKLQDYWNGMKLTFFNTHWDHLGAEARLKSARIMKEHIERLPSDTHPIITGDFNCTEESQPYKDLMATKTKAGTALVDSFRQCHPKLCAGTFHNFTGLKNGPRIDWILHDERLQCVEANIIRDHVAGIYPSDHFPITAVLESS